MNQHILILGAGRSASSLIQYLHKHARTEQWTITLCEKNPEIGQKRMAEFPGIQLTDFDVLNDDEANPAFQKADLVISMLPAAMHIYAALRCAKLGIHMITASYLTEEIEALSEQFAGKGKLLLMEMGLDPGIDHMSAMKVLDTIKKEGHELTGFETFTGGLLADNTVKDNPWQYKFTWNPRNVVMAGTGNVKFVQEGRYKYIPYHKLFERTEVIHIPGQGYFEGYANRDSLKYLDLYGLRGIKTLYRGTLRRLGFCKTWNIFVQLGATDDTYEMEGVAQMSHRQFINSFLSYNPHDSIELKLAHYMNLGLESEEIYRLKWLDLFSEKLVGLEKGTPAQILEHILKKKWTIDETDLDMIVMWHKFDFIENGRPKQIQSHMVAIGEDQVNTAMSKTVGLPMGIAAKMLLKGELQLTGTQIPTLPEIYEPVLAELESLGFDFQERETIS